VLLITRQLMISPFESVLLAKVALFVPAIFPFRSHWYTGALPPLTAVAVNVTGVPRQMLFCDATMLSDGVALELTFMVRLLLFTLAGTLQVASLVITQLILSPLAKLLLLKVALFVPALLPFISH